MDHHTTVQTNLDEIQKARLAGLDAARPASVERQHSNGKFTARERVDLLVDVGSFTEFGALVGPTRDTAFDGHIDAPADGVITGVASLDGRPIALASFDFMVAGGSNGSAGSLKMERLADIAMNDGLPLVMLLDGAGHRLQEGLDSWHFAWGFGLFETMAQMSGWVPMVSLMLGPDFGGPTNFAALSDFVVMVRGISAMGMAGPPLVKAATGESISKEELGGANIQTRRGVADLAVDSEQEAMDAARAFLSFLPSNSGEPPLRVDHAKEHSDAALLDTIVPARARTAYDVRRVINGIADDESVLELKPTHAPNVVTCFARLDGRAVGFIANQPLNLGGALDSSAAEKISHFVSLCDAFGLALVYLIDVPGFLGGSVAEESQLARRSGRMLYELGQATVPRFSVVMRKGYGGGYIAMNGGRSFHADLAVAWPTAEIAATPIDAALDIAYRRQIAAAPDPLEVRAVLTTQFQEHITPLKAAVGFGLDDIILPSNTRARLIDALRTKPTRRRKVGPAKPHGISPI
jgi:acetyl-CoA carboxylase carboxyltransferase component